MNVQLNILIDGYIHTYVYRYVIDMCMCTDWYKCIYLFFLSVESSKYDMPLPSPPITQIFVSITNLELKEPGILWDMGDSGSTADNICNMSLGHLWMPASKEVLKTKQNRTKKPLTLLWYVRGAQEPTNTVSKDQSCNHLSKQNKWNGIGF